MDDNTKELEQYWDESFLKNMKKFKMKAWLILVSN